MIREALLAGRLALRELRGGLAGFYVFIACIALGVAAISGVTSVARSLTDGISREGQAILGGDLAFSLVHREASGEELAFFRSAGDVGRIATMRAMVRPAAGTGQAMVELKAVDGAYPHGGVLILEDGATDGEARLAARDGIVGALADPDLADRLGIVVGDRILLGDAEIELRGLIRAEPDRLSAGLEFGPRLTVSLDALAQSGLLRPGSLVTWTYRVRLPESATPDDLQRVRSGAARLFPEAGWRVRSRENPSGGLRQNVERFSQFLALIALTALVAGGVGVGNAVKSFVDLKRPAIATLKCLGASRRLVAGVYLVQILLLAAIGIVLGLAAGAAMPFAARSALAGLIPVGSVSVYPGELAVAALCGVLVTLAFSLGPLGRAGQLPPTSLFADRAIAFPQRTPFPCRLAQLIALAAIAALAIALSHDRHLAYLYIIAVVASAIVLRALSTVVMRAAKRVRAIRGTSLRLAVRNIHRPGSLTPTVVTSLGLGLTLLVALALIDTNLRRHLTGEIVERAPDFFFLDVQRDEREPLVALLDRVAAGGQVESVPMLRGRFVAVDGVPVREVAAGEEASWALRGDRGLTYAETLPPNSTLTDGRWWPPDYEGEPLVSLEAEIAAALGISIGDTLTVNVLGRDLTARIANLRRVDWESLSINFVLVFSPNALRDAPHSYLLTLRLPDGGSPGVRGDVAAAVTAAFPGVTSVSVRDAIAQVNAVISDLATAVRAGAAIALVVSMLVLGGALAAGQRQRRQDAVILKALGATRRSLLLAFAMEYGLLGLATAFFALAAGSIAAWYVSDEVMDLPFAFHGEVAATAIALALAITLSLGLAGTWRVLSVKPARLLKNL